MSGTEFDPGRVLSDPIFGRREKLEQQPREWCERVGSGWIRDDPDQRRRCDALLWLINGGGGHEDGVDGLRALTVRGDGLIDFLAAYQEYLEENGLRAAGQQEPEKRGVVLSDSVQPRSSKQVSGEHRADSKRTSAVLPCERCGKPDADGAGAWVDKPDVINEEWLCGGCISKELNILRGVHNPDGTLWAGQQEQPHETSDETIRKLADEIHDVYVQLLGHPKCEGQKYPALRAAVISVLRAERPALNFEVALARAAALGEAASLCEMNQAGTVAIVLRKMQSEAALAATPPTKELK